jgi:hypothetical protein
MKNVVQAIGFAVALASALPAWGVPQGALLEDVAPGQAAGFSVLAAVTNVVYFPVRLGLTVLTAELGGLTGWMTGGDGQAAQAVWNVTDGQAFITPAVLEGREALRFGPWPNTD